MKRGVFNCYISLYQFRYYAKIFLKMKLKVDDVVSNEYKEHITIQELLDTKDIEAVPWLVISVNGVFVKREKFKDYVLNDGDVIEMIYIRGGG